jgi:signal transduction histidine kinase/tetratricopeptide (TPR) repeat protein
MKRHLGLKIAYSIKLFLRGHSKSLLPAAIMFVFVQAATAQTTSIERLRGKLEENLHRDTNKVKTLDSLGFELRNKLPNEAKEFFQEGLEISRELKYAYGELRSLIGLAFFHRFRGELSEAILYTEQAIEKAKALKDTANLIASIYNLAYTRNYLGELSESIGQSLEVLRLAEKTNSSKWVILANTQMGNTLLKLRELDKAQDCLDRALNLAHSVHDTDGIAHCLQPLTDIAIEKKKYDEARDLINKGLAISRADKDIANEIVHMLNSGEVYQLQDSLDNLLKNCQYVISLIERSDFIGYRPWAYALMGNYFMKIKNPDSVIYYCTKSLESVATRGPKYTLLSVNKLLAEAYFIKGNFKEAFSGLQRFLAFKDSLNETDAVSRVKAAQYKYELDKKQMEIDLLSTNEKLVRERNQQQKKLLWGAGIGLVVLLGLLSLLWKYNKDKIKAYEALKKQQEHLKATQSQLIQSEKMASLGELTAGIAHEIQNPLNFVNNFSEVNKELLVEMKDEMSKGNLDDANAIANDIIDNEEKINHHGKRADAIVKGMLQHSRSSSAVKEPTDINKLADEYLRLAYHGLKAKDKSFNTTMKTDFDGSIGKINIISQDIGRVLLNLYNNAFYAVNEKKKLNGDTYETIVSVSTKKVGDKVLVSVKDNGNGIPQKVLDKIFQPFFTTKPTGQGTGLGLSLSYDIVKAHGGEINVESKEGEGSAFTFILPVNNSELR